MNEEQQTTPNTAPTRWQVAVHEAAHAVYARAQAMIVRFVTVEGIVAVENGAEREPGMSFGHCDYDRDGESEGTWTGILGCALALVGPAAAHKAGWHEVLLLPYEEFLEVAEERHPRSDAGRVLASLSLADDPEALYEKARKEARAFVEERYPEIVALAERLMKVMSLNEESIELVFDPSWPKFREMLDEIAREDDLLPSAKEDEWPYK